MFARLGAEEAVRAIFAAAATEMESHGFTLGCPIGVPATEAAEDSIAIRDAVNEVYTAWIDAYATGLRDAGLDVDAAERLGHFIVAAYQGAATWARVTRSTQPYDDAADVLIGALHA